MADDPREDILSQYYDTRDIRRLIPPTPERGTLLPIMRTGDKLEPAVPGVIHEPWEAVKRLILSQYGPGSASTSGDIQPIKDSFEAAAAVAAPGLGLNAAGMMPKNAVGIFGGRLARTADHAALTKAEELAAKGADRKAIWDQTGWFQGADGKWRFEIDDQGARFTKGLDAARAHGPADIDMILAHDKLYEAYPHARNVSFYPTIDMNIGEGSFTRFKPDPAYPADRRTGVVRVGMDEEQPFQSHMAAERVTLHELQHAVQDREGFARGYNPTEATKDVAQARLAEQELRAKSERIQNAHSDEARYYLAKAAQGSPEHAKFVEDAQEKWLKKMGAKSDDNPYGITPSEAIAAELGERDAIFRSIQSRYTDAFRVAREDPHDLYKRHAGEVEARNVQTRMNMSPDERRAKPPWETQDIPDARQIIRHYEGDTQMSERPPMRVYRAGDPDGRGGVTFYSTERAGSEPYATGSGQPIKEYTVSPQAIFDTKTPEHRALYEQFMKETGHPGRYGKNAYPLWTAEYDFAKWLREKGHKFDAMRVDENTGIPSIAVYKND